MGRDGGGGGGGWGLKIDISVTRITVWHHQAC